MTATLQNFQVVSGDAPAGGIVFTVTDQAGAVVDLTGASVRWSARRLNSATVAIEKTTAAGGVEITDPTAGVFVVSLEAADTAALEGVYLHEAEVEDVAGNVWTAARGHMTITEDVVT